MAHDNQLKRTNDENEDSKSARTSLDVLADWWALSLQVWRDDPSEELALMFRETLKNFQPKILHKAFIRVTKNCKYRPTPAEVVEAANLELELLDQESKKRTAYEQISQEERNAALAETSELRESLRKTLHSAALPKPEPTMKEIFLQPEIFTREQWEATQKAYKEYLTVEANMDIYNRAHGIPPVPRSRQEQLAIYYNLPKHERERIRRQVRP